jgi:hypothetical protein
MLEKSPNGSATGTCVRGSADADPEQPSRDTERELMQPGATSAATSAASSGDRPRPRWLFRGRPGAWDTLAASLAADPTWTAWWPIAPSGPSMAVGDAVLLWRSGRGGGIAALCTVVAEPEARTRQGLPPEVVVGLRIARAYAHPIAPATLARIPLLRPLAFMDLLDETERRVAPAQEEALAALVDERERAASHDPDDVALEERASVPVPVRLLPLVEELLVALGADEPVPAPSAPRRPAERGPDQADQADQTVEVAAEPTDQQLAQAAAVRGALGTDAFTVDDAAKVWRTGVGTARSRIDRLVDSGLLMRTGTLRSDERPGGRPTRGRPPVLYRLASR